MNLFSILGNVFIYTLALCMIIKGIITGEILLFILAGLLILLSDSASQRKMIKELHDKLDKQSTN